MEALIAVLSIFSFLLLAIGIAYYVIGSIFAYKIAKLEGCTYPFLAWIPLAMYYNFFEMMKKDKFTFFGLFEIDKKLAMVLYIVWPVVANTVIPSSLIGLLNLCFLAFTICVFLNLYSELGLKSDILYAAISTILYPLGMYLVYKDLVSGNVKQPNEVESTATEVLNSEQEVKESTSDSTLETEGITPETNTPSSTEDTKVEE